MKARIAAATPPHSAMIQAWLEKIMPPGVPPLVLFTTLARDERLFGKFFSGGLLDKGHLSLRQRELVIDRTTALCRSEYEWGVHVALFADRVGLTAEQVRSLAQGSGEDACWDAGDKLLLDFCDALHARCTLDERLDRYYLSNIVGQPAENAVALSHLIFSGVLDRHPGLKVVAAHGGGYLPTCLGRADHGWRVRPEARACAEPPSTYLRRIWFDSLVYEPGALRALIGAAGASQVVLGSDHPFDMGVDDPLARLRAALPPGPDLDAVRGGNAVALFDLKEH